VTLYLCHATRRAVVDGAGAVHPGPMVTGSATKAFQSLAVRLGPTDVVGQHLALMEAVLGMAALLSRFRFELGNNIDPEISAWMTLRPKHGMVLSVVKR
jgi:hypothetical protein